MGKKEKISKTIMIHISKLSKVRLTKEEMNNYEKQISVILDFMESLNKVATHNIPETNQTTGLVNCMRDDQIKQSLTREDVLKNAPAAENGYFKIKTVLGRAT